MTYEGTAETSCAIEGEGQRKKESRGERKLRRRRGEGRRLARAGIAGLISAVMLMPSSAVTKALAEEFAGREDEYYTLCLSDALSPNDEKTCEEFSGYLTKVTGDELKKASEEKTPSDEDIERMAKRISSLDKRISAEEKRMDFIGKMTEKNRKELDRKKKEMGDRLYSQQSRMNSDGFGLSFILTGESPADVFSRLTSFVSLTRSEQQETDETARKQEELKRLQSDAEKLDDLLKKQKKEADEKKQKLISEMTERNASLQESIDMISQDSDIIRAAEHMKELGDATDADSVKDGILLSGDDTGTKIANAALSKTGHMYLWGAAGPDRFDCSGLVCWATNQAGVSIPRLTADGYSHMGTAVDVNDMRPGDVITFGKGHAYHIGIYIGGGMMVHAPRTGKPVSVTKLSGGYWQRKWNNVRRLY